MIKLKKIVKTYNLEKKKGMNEPFKIVEAVKSVDLEVKKGEFLSIMGPSGSGKSTLLSIIGCLDIPTSGDYLLDGINVASLNDDELSVIRNEKIGFIFQSFHLLPRYNALENVEIPLIYKGIDKDTRQKIAKESLAEVGLLERLFHIPSELSGGEQQRVAIARAIAHCPKIILADEPTGNLDSKTSDEIIALLTSLNKNKKLTIVMITHNMYVAKEANRILHMKDGFLLDENK